MAAKPAKGSVRAADSAWVAARGLGPVRGGVRMVDSAPPEASGSEPGRRSAPADRGSARGGACPLSGPAISAGRDRAHSAGSVRAIAPRRSDSAGCKAGSSRAGSNSAGAAAVSRAAGWRAVVVAFSVPEAAVSSAAEADSGAAVEAVVGGADMTDRFGRLIPHLVLVVIIAWSAVSPAGPTLQNGFNSPDDAVSALVTALRVDDREALAKVLGPGSEKLVRSGDPVKDRQEAQRFLDAYAERHTLVAGGEDRMVLHVGSDDWPLPIPLVRRDGEWEFDSHQGAQEIVDRRIGRNEIAAIRFALAYVDAQRAYFDLFKQVTGKGRYAMRLVSTDGNYDGLYWPPAPGIPESPLGSLVESAIEEGYPGQAEASKQIPYQGYYYRVLTAQGPNAPGGAKNNIEDDLLTGGFGLIAWPAIFGASGIMTFVVNQDGVVFQKDLGPETNGRVAAIRTFDPGLDWARVIVNGPDAGSH